MATISYDEAAPIAAFSQAHGIAFPMLSDAGSATIKKFGLLNPVPEWAIGPDKNDPDVRAEIEKYVSVVNPRATMIGMSFPGTFILDAQGRVSQRFFEDFYIERNTVSDILIKLGGSSPASVGGTRISSAHLDLTTYPSSVGVAPGDRFSVALDIEPHPKVHVYAPGAKGYKVISLTVEPDPHVRAFPVRYPTSEIYYFKPLNERVPVFQKKFRLVQEFVLEGTPQAQAVLRGMEKLTLKGTLVYQACTDKECFNPVSVPLSWTLALRPLVTQQPSQLRQP